jgi:predicted nucleic acid-binding protein
MGTRKTARRVGNRKLYVLEMNLAGLPYLIIKNRNWFPIMSIEETVDLMGKANNFVTCGVKAKDALHVSSAIEGKADYFVTTDDKLLKKLFVVNEIQAVNQLDIIGVIDEQND